MNVCRRGKSTCCINICWDWEYTIAHYRWTSFLQTKLLPVCVNGGGDDVGGGKGGRVNGSRCPRLPPPPPSRPWNETAAAGTSLGQRWDWLPQNLLWCWNDQHKDSGRATTVDAHIHLQIMMIQEFKATINIYNSHNKHNKVFLSLPPQQPKRVENSYVLFIYQYIFTEQIRHHVWGMTGIWHCIGFPEAERKHPYAGT